ncbi:MAG: Crp/Fnr family transcriptional regulator [Rickettsiales bacterium]|nr:Crp/Fnr family transcriptional regulator [Rickettsiales bacterium]
MTVATIAAKSPHHVNAEEILGNTLLFSGINAETLRLFASQAVVKTYSKNKILFLHEEHASNFYVIADGWVKLFRETLDGKEAIVDVLNKGHIFGETALFDNDSYAYSAEIIEDSTLLSIPLGLLKSQIEENSHVAMQMFRVMSRFRQQQDQELEHRNLQNAPQRIGCFLLRLCKPNPEGPIKLLLPYDKMLIASRLGMKPETFSRALTRLRKETGIRINGATVEIDTVDQLSQYSCSVCSSSYPCHDLH